MRVAMKNLYCLRKSNYNNNIMKINNLTRLVREKAQRFQYYAKCLNLMN